MIKLIALVIATAVLTPAFAQEKKVEEAKAVETAKKCQCKPGECKGKDEKKCKEGCTCAAAKAAKKAHVHGKDCKH